jgi:uncharacterized protein YxjI
MDSQAASSTPPSLSSSREIVMAKKILSVREHYDFQDRSGNSLGEGDGNFLQFPAKFTVLDQNGAEWMHLNGKLISIRREFDLFDPSGNMLGAIKKKLVKLIGHEYWIEQNGVELVRIFGNFVEHGYRFEINRNQVAEVHQRWLTVRDTYGVSITGDVDPRLVIGSVVAIEHEEVTERH